MILKPGNKVYVAKSNESLQNDFIELKSILKPAGIEVISYSGKNYDHKKEMKKVNQCNAFIMLPPNPLVTNMSSDNLDKLMYFEEFELYIGKGIGKQFQDCTLWNKFLYLSSHNNYFTTLHNFKKLVDFKTIPKRALYTLSHPELIEQSELNDWKYYYIGYFKFAYYIENTLEGVSKKTLPTDSADKPNSDPLSRYFLGK